MAGEVIVVGHIAQFHVFIVGHITCQFACRCITGDTYPRRETPMTVEEVAVTEIYFIPQFSVALAFLFKTFDLVVQLVTEGRGADAARYRQVRGLRCIFLFVFFFRTNDSFYGFADRQFIQYAETRGNGFNQLVQEITGCALATVKDGDIAKLHVFKCLHLFAGNFFPLVYHLILDSDSRVRFGCLNHCLEAIGFSQQ